MNWNPLWYWREWCKIRVCDTPREFATYAMTKLKTPEAIAYYTKQCIFYTDEEVNGWYPLEQALETKRGNCTEIAALNVYGLRLIGYKAEHLCIYGKDKQGKDKGHAVASFLTADGRKGIIEGKVILFPGFHSWATIAHWVREDWKSVERFCFKDEEGKTVKGFGL